MVSKHSTYIKNFDIDEEGGGVGRKFNLKIEEVKEDEEDKDSIYDKGGFSDYSGSNEVIINFESMFENVRKHEPLFKDSVDYCISYKARITYISIAKAEPEVLEAYMILTR